MRLELRVYEDMDQNFLKEMLYEAIFWRESPTKPTYDESLTLDFVKVALENFGKRQGDTAVVASIGQERVGAIWYRYWHEFDQMRGFVHETIPIIAIGVVEKHRYKGIGQKLMTEILKCAKDQSVKTLSLCVSKDNGAQKLYSVSGFRIYEDIGDSFIMTKTVL